VAEFILQGFLFVLICLAQGWDGKRGDGSIYKPEFVDKFSLHLRRITQWQGCHVVIGGGVSLIFKF
jgi:hypothetical protein